ncbi:MAG: transcription antitermination factor NusB [Acidimicrobiales bacterium]|nr:transcription antitermination factor NusB [Acidimicrobiales bacterium]
MSNSPLQLSRREDREAALALLYEADMTGDSIESVLERHAVDPHEYSTVIVAGVAAMLTQIDAAIDQVAEDWAIDRMPGIDRSILRMSTYELFAEPDVPVTAVVSEAVALANQYSTEKSAPFVNGVLVTLGDILRRTDESE